MEKVFNNKHLNLQILPKFEKFCTCEFSGKAWFTKISALEKF